MTTAEFARAYGELWAEGFRGCVERVSRETGVPRGRCYRALRVAITGRASGPPLDRVVALLEEGRMLQRLENR